MYSPKGLINEEVRDASISISRAKALQRVIEAISALGERHGSSTKEILNYVLKSGPTIDRNLTVKVMIIVEINQVE